MAITLAATRAVAQQPPVDDEDVEVSVPTDAAPTPSPAPPPPEPPAASPAPSPPPAAAPPRPAATAARPRIDTHAAPADQPPSAALGLPSSTAPAGRDESAPRSLVAEGTNYVRPIRRGLRWWGFVQAQYERNQLSEDELAPGGAPLNQDQFSLRRGRLRLDHGWENAAATLELDASTHRGIHVTPRRAEASVFWRGQDDDAVTPRLVLTAGITDLPFGAEIGESQRDRVFMERSIGSLALFPSEADAGAKVWGAYRFLNYAVAVVNGQPLHESALPRDPNTAKDVVGRIGTRVAVLESLALEGGVSFYEGRGFSPGVEEAKDTVTWVDDNNNGFLEPHEVQGVPGSAAVPSQSFDRWALALDLGTSARSRLGITRLNGELIVASNLDRGLLLSDPIASGANIRQLVLATSLVQQVTDYGFVGLRLAHYDPNSDLFEQRAGVFHIKDQSLLVVSPALGLTLAHGRIVAQYDVVSDKLGRDERGVPANAKNDQLTVRLQVDL